MFYKEKKNKTKLQTMMFGFSKKLFEWCFHEEKGMIHCGIVFFILTCLILGLQFFFF